MSWRAFGAKGIWRRLSGNGLRCRYLERPSRHDSYNKIENSIHKYIDSILINFNPPQRGWIEISHLTSPLLRVVYNVVLYGMHPMHPKEPPYERRQRRRLIKCSTFPSILTLCTERNGEQAVKMIYEQKTPSCSDKRRTKCMQKTALKVQRTMLVLMFVTVLNHISVFFRSVSL